MNHIDITFDMETCATTANAAVMQVAAVAWNRAAKENPFFWCEIHTLATFNEHIDLRSCVVDQVVGQPNRQGQKSRHRRTGRTH